MKYFRSTNLSPLQTDFKIYPDIHIIQAETIIEAQSMGADLIDLAYQDYLAVFDQFAISSIESHSLGAADCLIRIKNKYHFYQLSQGAFLQMMTNLKISLRTTECAVLVGDELTLSQFLPPLTQLGYCQFVFVTEFSDKIISFVEKIKKTYLGLSIDVLNFNQLSTIEGSCSFLLVDIDHSQQAELVESLTYFNFLTTGSLFFDIRSGMNQDLIGEAERAQMFVVDVNLFYQSRILLANQILTKKNK